MADIDDLLGALAAKAPPPALASLESDVFLGLARHRERATARRGMVLAVAAAAVVGIVGAVAPAAPAQAEPLFGVPQDAPSKLLAD
ncbi:MAG: hypothetical protein NTX28_12195 [Novosphingobium sp.]|nr:hypothetical protein [Novosphingobium sp.]